MPDLKQPGRSRSFVAAGDTARARLDHWRSWLAEVSGFEVVSATLDDSSDFRAKADLLEVGNLTFTDHRVGPATVTYRSADHGADWLRIGLVLRNVEGRNGPGEICLWRPHCGQWRSDVPVAVTSVRLPRRAVRVADTVLDHWERTALPLSSPAVSVLLQPMLAGLVGRVAALASSPVVADLPDHWTRAITLALRALPVPDSTRDGRPLRVQQLYDLIDAQLGDPKLDAGWLARQMHVSRRSLYLLVPDSDGGVATLIRNRRMQRARDLLRDADHDGRTIAEIGRAVGLPSAAHFTRLFRAAYGITPSAFRAARDDNGRVAGQPESS